MKTFGTQHRNPSLRFSDARLLRELWPWHFGAWERYSIRIRSLSPTSSDIYFWSGIALGSLAVLMLQYLTGGEWGVVIRRPLEAATRTLPVLVLLFIPLAFGMQGLYARAHTAQATDTSSASQDPYLFTKFVLLRAAIYFAAWLLLAYLLNHWSRKQDGTTDQRWSRRLQTLSGPGLVVYGFTASFAGIDWVMSLQADWNSTIFGMLVMGSQVLSALAFIVIISVVLGASPPSLKFSRPNTFTIWGSCS